MKDSTKQQLGDWYTTYPNFWESELVEQVIKQISSEYHTKRVYPEPNKIFRAFELCQFRNIKAVILGMDPYNDGNAIGLAFGVGGHSVNPSLRKIREAIEDECYDGMLLEFDYTLEHLAKQGVLLLNTALTVRHGEAGSHMEIWSAFTKRFIEQLSVIKPVTWFLWGKNAEAMKQYIYTDNPVYIAEHPSYAARNGRKWITNNQFKQTKHIIKW